jgi:multidrug efflux pump subunit AcrB
MPHFAGYIAMHLGAELIPSLTQGEFAFEVRLPEGKALQQTDAVIRSLELEVAAFPADPAIESVSWTFVANGAAFATTRKW